MRVDAPAASTMSPIDFPITINVRRINKDLHTQGENSIQAFRFLDSHSYDRVLNDNHEGGHKSWVARITTRISFAFERTSKRRKGYPSETNVKRGMRIVRGEKELIEKLGRNDLRPCGLQCRFQELLLA